MSNDRSAQDYRAANLAAWEEAGPIHRRHNQAELLKLFRQPGISCLDDTATKILSDLDISGKNIAQVCCNNGIELLSVKSLGAARCVGFDGAAAFLEQGQELARAAGHDVEFVCCDAYEIPETYHASFDVVMITIGVLGWMPDIDGFFAAIGKLVKPGGAVFVYEHHPIVVMIKPDQADAPIEWELSYFRTDPYIEEGGLDYYGGETYDAKPAVSFCHKLSDILMAAVKTGMAIEHFEELPHHISNAWWNVEASDIGLPMCYTLVLRKTG